MIHSKPSLSVSIPAYNEETNISNIINAVLAQKRGKFNLKEILVYSDASTDKTHKIVVNLTKKNRIVKLIKGKKRMGKYFRLAQSFKKFKSDYLIILDADTGLVGKDFLEKLVNILITDKNADMVAAHNILLRHDNFVGKIIHAHLMIWDYIRLSIPRYDSGLNFFGSATAYRGSFARSITMPAGLLDPHLFIYLTAKKTNGFRYCHDAKVVQWSISTIDDLKKLLNRTIGKKDEKLEKIFGKDVKKIYFVPVKYKIKGLLKAFRYQPFYTLLSLILHLYITKIFRSGNTNKSPVWDIISSTKKPISYEK